MEYASNQPFSGEIVEHLGQVDFDEGLGMDEGSGIRTEGRAL